MCIKINILKIVTRAVKKRINARARSHFTAMDRQRLDRIETLLFHIQNQLTKVERLLNNDNRSPDLDDLAEKRREALERHRIQFERHGRSQPVSRKWSELGEDEID